MSTSLTGRLPTERIVKARYFGGRYWGDKNQFGRGKKSCNAVLFFDGLKI